jgi:hypothetical protein
MASSVPPVAPSAAQPPAKKTSPLVWILVGCASLILLAVIVIAAAVGFGLYKAKQAGLDPELIKKNPAVAMVKMAVAANPDAEIVKLDENRGVVTIRNKKTGKTVTMNFEDVKRGRFSFEGENGERMTVEGQGDSARMRVETPQGTASYGAGSSVNLPSWFPAYSGATPVGTFSVSDNTSESAGFRFTTHDSPSQVLEFYENGLKEAGLEVTTLNQGSGGMVTGQNEAQGRHALVRVSESGGETQVVGSFKSRK